MGSRFSQVQEINALPSAGPDSLEASPWLEQVCPCSRRGSDPVGQQAESSAGQHPSGVSAGLQALSGREIKWL